MRWAKYFANKGHEVHLISFGASSENTVENVNMHLLTMSHHPILRCYPIRIRRLIRKIDPDILHAHYISGYGLLGALSGFHPFILSAWGSDVLVTAKESKMEKWSAKFAIKKADVLHCDADHIMAPLMELGAKPEKINIVYFGVDTQRFRPMSEDNKLRNELGLFDSPVIISLRNLEPIYDIETLINSIPLVLKEIPKAKFVVVGSGSQEVRLKEYAKSLAVSASVIFTGRIPNNEPPKYFNSADIYVSTSLSDAGLAASTAEAMACGLPVIITDFGDNRKWVKDGTNGFLIPLRNPEALATKIIYLIRNKEIRNKFGQINRQTIVERNDWQTEMGKVEKLYETSVKKNKK